MYILKRSMSCPSRTSIAGPYVPAVLWVRLSIVSLPSISTASFASDRVRWRAGDGLCQFLYVRLAKRYVMFSSDRYWHWWTSLKKSWTYQLWIQPSIHERYLDSASFFAHISLSIWEDVLLFKNVDFHMFKRLIVPLHSSNETLLQFSWMQYFKKQSAISPLLLLAHRFWYHLP